MGKNIRSSSSPKALAASFPMPPLADALAGMGIEPPDWWEL